MHLHQRLASEVRLGKEPYKLRTEDTWVTSLEDRLGRLRYMRSDLVSGAWASVAITAESGRSEILNGIATSISKGFQRDYSFDDDGKIAQLTELALAWAEEDKETEAIEKRAVEEPKSVEKPKPTLSSGTGFYINSNGSVLTNQHVINNCSQVLCSSPRLTGQSGGFV